MPEKAATIGRHAANAAPLADARLVPLLRGWLELKASAGSEVEREREPVLGNLYAVIRAESERSDRVAKLVRMKKLLELTKQKRKAETLGIDGDAFVESVAAPDDEVPAAPVTADSILAAWKEEGLDAESQEIEKLQYAIDDLEGTLGQD